jgi:hypothetical protein
METSAFAISLARRTSTASWLEKGREVSIQAGPLAGLRGILQEQTAEGRWLVQCNELGPGVLLAMPAGQLGEVP